MPLDVDVGLGPGHIVLDGDLDPPPQKGVQPPIFGPCLLWPNGWMDQDATWYEGRPVGLGPGRIVLHGDPISPSQKGHSLPPPMSAEAIRSPISATAEHLFQKSTE